jgi:hypothetical protein
LWLEFLTAIALMMEAVNTSERLINLYQSTLRYNPEGSRHPNLFNLFTSEENGLLAGCLYFEVPEVI